VGEAGLNEPVIGSMATRQIEDENIPEARRALVTLRKFATTGSKVAAVTKGKKPAAHSDEEPAVEKKPITKPAKQPIVKGAKATSPPVTKAKATLSTAPTGTFAEALSKAEHHLAECLKTKSAAHRAHARRNIMKAESLA